MSVVTFHPFVPLFVILPGPRHTLNPVSSQRLLGRTNAPGMGSNSPDQCVFWGKGRTGSSVVEGLVATHSHCLQGRYSVLRF